MCLFGLLKKEFERSLYLGDASRLTFCFSLKTGTMRAVRRHLFSQHSAPGRGVVWEWLSDDGSWTAYEASVCDYLEQQVARGNQLVDLAPLGYNYTVNSATQTQTNKTSSFCRSVRRQAGPPYPVTTIIAPPGHTGVACSCHQCLSGSGTGPVSGRYRHSMTNLPAYPAPQHPPHRTAFVFGAHQAFAPYSKPSLSGARSVPRLNTTNPWAAAPPSLGSQPLYRSSLSHLGLQHLPPGSSTSGAVRYRGQQPLVLSALCFHSYLAGKTHPSSCRCGSCPLGGPCHGISFACAMWVLRCHGCPEPT